MAVHKKLSIESNNATLCIYAGEEEAGSQRGICTLMFITVLFTKAKMWKQPKCPLRDK